MCLHSHLSIDNTKKGEYNGAQIGTYKKKEEVAMLDKDTEYKESMRFMKWVHTNEAQWEEQCR